MIGRWGKRWGSGTCEVGLTNTGKVSLKVCCCILRKNPPQMFHKLKSCPNKIREIRIKYEAHFIQWIVFFPLINVSDFIFSILAI